MPVRFYLAIGLFCVFGLSFKSFAASDRELSSQKLERIQQQIQSAKSQIEKRQGRKSRIELELQQQDGEILHLGQQLRQTESKIETQKIQLGELQHQQLDLKNQIARQRDALARQVYTSFTLGQQEKLQLLFNQQQPEKLQRILVYYQYFNRERSQLIEQASMSLKQLQVNQQQLLSTQQQLQQSRQLLSGQLRKLKNNRQKRLELVKRLQQQLVKDGQYLQRLQDDENELQQLISSIDEALEIEQYQIPDKPFYQLRGQLYWPVEGRVNRLFGTARKPSTLRWQGVIIETNPGSYVYSVAPGRVVFADYMRGMGNLIIIDHGNQYLSLYGHNESLFKLAGEQVEAGEIIASSGSPPGTNGVYFEIRKKGKPLNPTRWCKLSRTEG